MRVSFSNLVELQEQSCAAFAANPFLGTLRGGAWSWTRYDEFAKLVDRARGGLASLGVGPGDAVAFVSNNRLEWAVACYATYGLGASFVPMYEAQRGEEREFILGDCGAKVVFASSASICDAISGARARLPSIEQLILLEGGAGPEVRTFESLLDAGSRGPVPSIRPDPETIAGLVYTSGTTGKPKGVELTHRNIASNVTAVSEIFELQPSDRSLSFLPWTHSYGQTGELHYLMSQGASSAINDALPNLVENMASVKPTMLVAVPGIFNKIYAGVNAQVARRPAPVRKLFRDGLRSAARRRRGERLGWLETAELSVDERLIFKKVREKFGGRLDFVISASAALSPEVAEFIDALGITVYEGYGLTETSPVVTANAPGARKHGSVGRAIPGVRVEIVPVPGHAPGVGEVVVHGPNVMRGYHHRPEENAAALTADGGLRTGDLGHLDADGYLFITGRLKEQYKLENGKYVMPSVLEEVLKLSPYIANALVHGANRPFNVALVVPEPDAVRRWAREAGVALGADLAADPKVRELLEREVATRSEGFRGFERPGAVLVLPEDFTPENGLLTPTLKLKRRLVESRYARDVDALYAACDRARAS